MKLISMTDFVLETTKNWKSIPDQYQYSILGKVNKYANFLKRPLELSMFIPCDDEGNVMEDTYYVEEEANEQYQESKAKILFMNMGEFSDINLLNDIICDGTKTIEFLIENDFKNITLTDNAIKQLGL